nr:hypothetical protein [Pseudomonadota bacterium]
MAINFFSLIVALTLLTYYVVQYTDLGPELGGLFTLSGVFAWLAFFLNLLSDDFRKALQQEFEARFLRRRHTWMAVLV